MGGIMCIGGMGLTGPCIGFGIGFGIMVGTLF
jgi:hypothetical protein